MKFKKLIYIFAVCCMLGGCVSEAVEANTLPAAVYVTSTEETDELETMFTTIVTEGVTAEALTEESTAETTASATTTTVIETTLATTTVTSATTSATTPETTVTRKPEVITNTITLLGPNMVYTGESFEFTYKISHKNADRASVFWQCKGDAGKLTESGKFEAIKAGTVTLRVTDVSNGLSDTLTVHVVDSPEDVDFVPEVNGIPIANKTYPVPKDYNPGLTAETYNAFMELKQGALEDGIEISFMSGYRSYYEQMEVYADWVATYPEGGADRVSARPGHSEHQLGLAIDVNSIYLSFADTDEGKWLAKNCYKYGFIIRYTEQGEPITGYIYEPWHIRYLGKDLAYDVHFSGLTLEEYLGIDSYYRIEEYDISQREE